MATGESKERAWVWSIGKTLIPGNWVYLNRERGLLEVWCKGKEGSKGGNESGRNKIGLQKSEDKQIQLLKMAQLIKETALWQQKKALELRNIVRNITNNSVSVSLESTACLHYFLILLYFLLEQDISG